MPSPVGSIVAAAVLIVAAIPVLGTAALSAGPEPTAQAVPSVPDPAAVQCDDPTPRLVPRCERWITVYEPDDGSLSKPRGFAFDSSRGLAFVVGALTTLNGDVHTVAVDTNTGDVVWDRTFDAGPGLVDRANDVVVDEATGTVLVLALSGNSVDDADTLVLSYSAGSGDLNWATKLDGFADLDDHGGSAAFDEDSGTLFLTGGADGGSGDTDIMVAAVDASSGSMKWVTLLGDRVGGNDRGTGITVGPTGDSVYVTGFSEGDATSGKDWMTVRLKPDSGQLVWSSIHDGPAHSRDFPTAVAVDAGGHRVFVVGDTLVPGRSFDATTVAYNATTGAEEWVGRVDDGDNGADFANAIAVGGSPERVYVAGAAGEMLVVAYTMDGDLLWQRSIESAYGSNRGAALDIALDPVGHALYVSVNLAGVEHRLDPQAPQVDLGMLVLDRADGTHLETKRYNGPEFMDDWTSFDLMLVTDQGPIVAGASLDLDREKDWVILAYPGALD